MYDSFLEKMIFKNLKPSFQCFFKNILFFLKKNKKKIKSIYQTKFSKIVVLNWFRKQSPNNCFISYSIFLRVKIVFEKLKAFFFILWQKHIFFGEIFFEINFKIRQSNKWEFQKIKTENIKRTLIYFARTLLMLQDSSNR